MKKRKDFDDLMDEAIQNIRDDRQETKNLLKDITSYITSGSDHHKEVGFTIAKYLETLQRSNEQLVKITSLLKKKDSDNTDLSDDDRNSIFEELNYVIKDTNKKPQKVK